MKCTTTVSKMSAVGNDLKNVLIQLEKYGKEWKVYQYSSENAHGYDMESSTTVSKIGAIAKVY
jgi:hypothetical protein